MAENTYMRSLYFSFFLHVSRALCCSPSLDVFDPLLSLGDQLKRDLLDAEKEESVVVVSLLLVLRNVLLLNLGAGQNQGWFRVPLHNSF